MPDGRYTHGYSSTLSAESIALDNLEDDDRGDDGLIKQLATAALEAIHDPATDMPSTVYFCSDHRGRLLYVGMTTDVDRRIRAHRQKDWWQDVAHIRRVPYQSRRDAAIAEAEAIRKLAPEHNIRQPRPERTADSVIAAVQLIAGENPPLCSHCETDPAAPSRDLCNACNMYRNRYGVPRPQHLIDRIRARRYLA